MAVTLSERAAQHVTSYLAKRGKGVGIRLGVRTTGCSGMAHKLEFAEQDPEGDEGSTSHGVAVILAPKTPPHTSSQG